MQKWQEWQTASDADWSAALKREAIIRPLAEQVRLSESAVVEAAESLGLGRVTIYRLVNRYKRRPQTSSLLPRKRGRANRRTFLRTVRAGRVVAILPNMKTARRNRTGTLKLWRMLIAYALSGVAPHPTLIGKDNPCGIPPFCGRHAAASLSKSQSSIGIQVRLPLQPNERSKEGYSCDHCRVDPPGRTKL